MPIYEYRCRECGGVTEALVPMGGKACLPPHRQADVACSKCGSRKLERKFSTFGTGGSSSGASADACTGYT